MKNKNKIKINKDKQAAMINLIKDYFMKERNEDLGDLASALILDFFLEELAPLAYNQGVHDSYKYLTDRLEGLFELEKY